MADMTNEEYDALDELWTKTTPQVNFDRPGVFARQHNLLESLDGISASYIRSRAEAAHKTPSEIVDELVREKIAADPVMAEA